MPGDRVPSEGGPDVEFRHFRSGRAPRVVTEKMAAIALVGGMLTGGTSVGAVANFVFKAAVREELASHNRDPEAHSQLVRAMERMGVTHTVDGDEKRRLQTQLDTLQRKVEETREIVIRLETQLRRGGR
jgi:lipid A disaccharide synthetase